jgi:DNA-binding transcriptional LysR family regulator
MLRPTREGEAAIARAAQIEREVEALGRGIGGADAEPAGVVRLTTVPILANRLLVPALPDLFAEHPLLQIELIAESRNLHLTRREADIALRLARPEAGTALARRIGQLDYAVYAPVRGAAADLPWITYEDGLGHLPQARWIAAQAQPRAPAPLRVNDAEAILHAVRAGLGKSLLPCFVAEGAKDLARIGARVVLSREVWLVVHRDLRAQGRIAAVIGWLEAAVRTCRARR